MLTFISLFAGIGGFELGFERAGMVCEQQVEIDDNCNEVLAHHWPEVCRLKDVRDVGRHNLKTVDLICGGFPCQDISVAGRRKGLAGKRSGLWFEFYQIVEEIRPKWVVVENVPGLLSSNGGRDLATILSGLEECGYWWAYRTLDAQYFGIPQRRRRVFIVGCLARGRAQEVLFERESSPWDSPPSRETGAQVADPITKSFAKHSGRSAGKDSYPRNMIMSPLDSPQKGHRPLVGDHLVFPGMAQAGAGWPPPSMPIDEDKSGPLDTKRAQCVAYRVHAAESCAKKDRAVETDYARCLDSLGSFGNAQGGTLVCNAFNGYTGGADDNDAQGRHLVALGLSENQCAELRLTPYSRQITSGGGKPGQGYPCVMIGWHENKQGELTPSNIAKAIRAGASHSYQGIGVRRLTPLECERLQGFPDGWTAVNDMSDSARYRMLGNAVCVPVAEWLGKRIVQVELGS